MDGLTHWIKLLTGIAGAALLASEIVRYRRRRGNAQIPQDPATDRWLRGLGWCATTVLGTGVAIVVHSQFAGPKWLMEALFGGFILAAAGAGLCAVVLGWRNGLRIARLMNWR